MCIRDRAHWGNVIFNPREYTISKVRSEGGRHTPFQNKYRPQGRMFSTLSNASKSRHDIAMNSIRNMK